MPVVSLPYNFVGPMVEIVISMKPHLVPNSMLVYVEVPMCLPPTMTALAAEGT